MEAERQDSWVGIHKYSVTVRNGYCAQEQESARNFLSENLGLIPKKDSLPCVHKYLTRDFLGSVAIGQQAQIGTKQVL